MVGKITYKPNFMGKPHLKPGMGKLSLWNKPRPNTCFYKLSFIETQALVNCNEISHNNGQRVE